MFYTCLSVHRGGGLSTGGFYLRGSASRGGLHPGGLHPVDLPQGVLPPGVLPAGGSGPEMQTPLELQKQAVCILLEYFLVVSNFNGTIL